jgi:hypothetical protein
MASYCYPSEIDVDFEPRLLQQAQDLFTRPLPELYPILIQLLADGQTRPLLALLRYLLIIPTNQFTVGIMGWFVVNSLVPLPLTYLYLKRLSSLTNTKEGAELNIIFARAILPRIMNFTIYVRSVLSIPGLQYLEFDLYCALMHVTRVPSKFDYAPRSHVVTPRPYGSFIPIHESPPISAIADLPSTTVMTRDLTQTLKTAATLRSDLQQRYVIELALRFQPTAIPVCQTLLLGPICEYVRLLLAEPGPSYWEIFELYPQLTRLGEWVGVLTVALKRLPPLHLLNLPRLLRCSVERGMFGPALVFASAFFQRAGSIFRLPNPLAVACLEIVAAVAAVPGLRTDVVEQIAAFGRLHDIEVTALLRRTISIPPTSWDLAARFRSISGEVGFMPAPIASAIGGSEPPCDAAMRHYLRYRPLARDLAPAVRALYRQALAIERYYFVRPWRFILQSARLDPGEFPLQSVMSLALVNSHIVAPIGTSLLRKLARQGIACDFRLILRYVFPTRAFLQASLRCKMLCASDVNALFAELLTNAATGPLAAPIITALLPVCFESAPGESFVALSRLTGISRRAPDSRPSPQLEKRSFSLLGSFLGLLRTPTDPATSDFIGRLAAAMTPDLVSLFILVLGTARKRSSPRTATAIDYTAIDSVAFLFKKFADARAASSLATSAYSALHLVRHWAVATRPHGFFRLIHRVLSVFGDAAQDRAVDFLDAVSPAAFPAFSICWMQLVMHDNAFKRFFESGKPRLVEFCVGFAFTSIHLAITFPDVFYPAVLKMFITIAAVVPLFFVAYHCVLIDALPSHYVQLRNVILGATPQWRAELTPPIGFNVGREFQGTVLRSLLDPFLTLSETPLPHSAGQLITATLRRSIGEVGNKLPRLIWELVFFCISTVAPTVSQVPNTRRVPIVDLFVSISVLFEESVQFIIEAIADNVRFPNVHTMFSVNLLFAIFLSGNDLCKEVLIGVLLKRMLCVTPPPRQLIGVFEKLIGRYSPPPPKTAEQRRQFELLAAARTVLDVLENRILQ